MYITFHYYIHICTYVIFVLTSTYICTCEQYIDIIYINAIKIRDIISCTEKTA